MSPRYAHGLFSLFLALCALGINAAGTADEIEPLESLDNTPGLTVFIEPGCPLSSAAARDVALEFLKEQGTSLEIAALQLALEIVCYRSEENNSQAFAIYLNARDLTGGVDTPFRRVGVLSEQGDRSKRLARAIRSTLSNALTNLPGSAP